MKAKRQIESTLNSVTMLDGTGGHVIGPYQTRQMSFPPSSEINKEPS